MATKNICIANGGFMDDRGKCSFTQSNCVNFPVPPMSPCDLIIDPSAQCKRGDSNHPLPMVCKGAPTLASYDIDKSWSSENNRCVASNGVIKTLCQINGLPYDSDKGICKMTTEICESKAGKANTLSDGTVDCQIPLGQSIAEGLFGKTLTDSLIQTFDPKQYKCPHDGLVDMSDSNNEQ